MRTEGSKPHAAHREVLLFMAAKDNRPACDGTIQDTISGVLFARGRCTPAHGRVKGGRLGHGLTTSTDCRNGRRDGTVVRRRVWGRRRQLGRDQRRTGDQRGSGHHRRARHNRRTGDAGFGHQRRARHQRRTRHDRRRRAHRQLPRRHRRLDQARRSAARPRDTQGSSRRRTDVGQHTRVNTDEAIDDDQRQRWRPRPPDRPGVRLCRSAQRDGLPGGLRPAHARTNRSSPRSDSSARPIRALCYTETGDTPFLGYLTDITSDVFDRTVVPLVTTNPVAGSARQGARRRRCRHRCARGQDDRRPRATSKSAIKLVADEFAAHGFEVADTVVTTAPSTTRPPTPPNSTSSSSAGRRSASTTCSTTSGLDRPLAAAHRAGFEADWATNVGSILSLSRFESGATEAEIARTVVVQEPSGRGDLRSRATQPTVACVDNWDQKHPEEPAVFYPGEGDARQPPAHRPVVQPSANVHPDRRGRRRRTSPPRRSRAAVAEIG